MPSTRLATGTAIIDLDQIIAINDAPPPPADPFDLTLYNISAMFFEPDFPQPVFDN